MRQLNQNELSHVSGAGCSPSPPSRGRKGNNGFGNGADDDLEAPGNSGKTGGGKDGSVGDSRGPR